METVKRSVVVRGWGEGRDEQGEHRGLLGQLNYSVYDMTGVDTCPYVFSKPLKCTITGVNSNVNYELWVLKQVHGL